MYIPEWEVEKSIVWNPNLLEDSSTLSGLFNGIQFIERQKYLKTLGRYIDILFKKEDKYIIVEVKCTYVDDLSIVTDQILEYKKGLAKELKIPEEKIICVLATPKGFSESVKEFCNKAGVITIKIDENKIVNILSTLDSSKFSLLSDFNKMIYQKILEKRGIFINPKAFENINDKLLNETKSVRTWIKYGIHDELAKKKIAELFKEISENAPICAHEVGTGSNGKLLSNYDKWFWLFYSVLDRRSNAANFIKAKSILEKKKLYNPYHIVKLVNKIGEAKVISLITKTLEESNFPLIYDTVMGKESQPKSIVDAARFISRYNFNFDVLYEHHLKKCNGDLDKTYKSLRKDIQSNIYGAGPRIVSQFIRGMVLKGNWRLPLIDDLLLEKCSFNVRFASSLRLCLIEKEESYYKDLGVFADKYLDGNRGIISHALWYIRKRYCDKKILCNECRVAGYCRYYLKNVLNVLSHKNTTLEKYL